MRPLRSNPSVKRDAPPASRLRAPYPNVRYQQERFVERVANLPNLGPKSEQMLLLAGITSLAQLKELGAVRAFCQVKRAGANASLNLLWALEGAILGIPWQVVAREHRTSLLLALEDFERDT